MDSAHSFLFFPSTQLLLIHLEELINQHGIGYDESTKETEMSLTSYSKASHDPAESQLTSSNAKGKKYTCSAQLKGCCEIK